MSSIRKFYRKVHIRTKVLSLVIGISVIGILSIGLLSLNSIVSISDYINETTETLGTTAAQDSEQSLVNQTSSLVNLLAREQALSCSLKMESMMFNAKQLADYAGELFEHPERYPLNSVPTWSGKVEGTRYGAIYTKPNSVALTDETMREIGLLSNMPTVIKTILPNPSITDLYVGMESGMFYYYSEVDGPFEDFDARTRPWYGVAKENPDQVVFSDLYEDVSGHGTIISAAKAVLDQNGNVIGVAGVDIMLTTLIEDILTSTMDTSGFSFILSKDGEYVIHPEHGQPDYVSKPLEDVGSQLDSSYQEALRAMMNGDTGSSLVSYQGVENYLFYTPMSVNNWTLGVMIPKDEIVSAAQRIKSDISQKTDESAAAMRDMISGVLVKLIIVAVVVLALAIFLSLAISNAISKPIVKLSQDAVHVGKGNFDYRVAVESEDEIGVLASSFNDMIVNIVEYMDNLSRITAERERLGGELRIASNIQKDMLPSVYPRFSDLMRAKVFATMEPAMEIGGDFYDIFFLDDAKKMLCTVVGDVSGKGMPAALFMVITKTLIKNFTLENPNPAEVLQQVNKILSDPHDNQNSMFVTIFLCITNLDTGHCKFSNGGHNPPIRIKSNGETVMLDEAGTTPLGFFDDSEYHLDEMVLDPKEKLFMYTDGVTEAMNPQDEEWGEERLHECLQRHMAQNCEQLIESVREDIRTFADGAQQSDDITMLVLTIDA